MLIQRIRYKLLTFLALALGVGFFSMAYVYERAVEDSIIDEYQRALHRITDSVIVSIETVMSENHAEIMPEYARRLAGLKGVLGFRIARVDGTEAYLDNRTIHAVNGRLGEEMFQPRPVEKPPAAVFLPGDLQAKELITLQSETAFRVESSSQGNVVQFYDIIPAGKKCKRCHGDDESIRGIVKVTSSLAEAERSIVSARLESATILALSMLFTLGVGGYFLNRFVARPIEDVSEAMAKMKSGEFDAALQPRFKDEFGKMVESFNAMRIYLRDTYASMMSEQEKLGMILKGAEEAVVVTDAAGEVVLVNAAACQLLDKTEEQIRAEGIVKLVNRPDQLQRMLDDPDGRPEPVLIPYGKRWLLGSASTIRDEDGQSIGSAALFRDVTQEQNLLLELQMLSTTDALTEIYNRRHLDATLRTEMDRARETGMALSVIMLDVDHFKRFNDVHGHDQGDRVLKMVGQVMKESVREYDIPCRYGGEEFAIVLPATDSTGALHVAERLRHDVEAMRVDGLQVTVSLGIACYPDVEAATPERLIAAADAALYRSKEDGRNRCTVSTSSAAST